MRRWFLMAALVALAAVTFGEGKPEAGVVNLTVAGGRSPAFDQVIADFQAANPARLRWIQLSFADGSTMAQDAMIAAGIYPNVLVEFAGRLSKLAVRDSRPGAWQAQDLRPYVSDQIMVPQAYYTNGMLLMAPQTMPAQAMALNVDLLDKAGYKLPPPDKWTLDEFKAMCAMVKANVPGSYGTVMFGKNPSADYLWMNWFSTFGYTSLYNATHTAANLAGSEKVWQFFADVVANGWAPPEAAELWDDAALEVWQHGTIAAIGIRPDWIRGYLKGAVDNKWIEKPFRVVMYPFPRTTIPTQTVGAGNGIVACDTGDPRVDAMAGKLVQAFLSQKTIAAMVGASGDQFPVRKDVVPKAPPADETQWFVAAAEIVKTAGYLDVGYTLRKYSDIRAEGFPLLQAVWTGKMTPKVAADTYVARINEILR